MYRKILLAGTTAAVIVGAGGTAMALTGSDTTSGSPSTGSSSSATAGHQGKHGKHGKKDKFGRFGKRLEHGQFTLKGKDDKTTTVDVINGTVTAVSPTSITVQAADKKTETFSVTSKTKVVERTVSAKKSGSSTTKGDHKPTKISISQVKKGDHVFVLGTGTSSYTAKRVMDIHGSK